MEGLFQYFNIFSALFKIFLNFFVFFEKNLDKLIFVYYNIAKWGKVDKSGQASPKSTLSVVN